MAYTYVSAVALPRSAGAQWVTPNLSSVSMNTIFNTYEQVFLVLSNTLLVDNVYVDLQPYRLAHSGYTSSLATWLSDVVQDTTLDVVPSLPSEHISFVTYSQAVVQRYKVSLTAFGIENPNDYPEVVDDLKITRPLYTTDMAKLQSHALISVNGFIHSTAMDVDGSLCVRRGAKSAKKIRLNNVGITSFMNVGALTKLPILRQNINKLSPTTDLIDGLSFSVDLPSGMDLSNKSYFLVLGGYMVFVNDGTVEPIDALNPGTFWRNGSTSFRLNLNNLQYRHRIFESHPYLDLDSLGISQTMADPTTMNIADLELDYTVESYLCLPETFLVVVDTPMLQVKPITIKNQNTPGHFTCYQDPIYPLCVGYGRMAEYIKEKTKDVWSVAVADSYTRNYVFGHRRPPQDGRISAQLVPYQPYTSLSGKLIQISGHR